MIRLAFVADSQVDERHRLEEHDRVMAHVVQDAAARGCAALLHGGDLYERRATVRERESVRAWTQSAEALGMPVLGVAGNHEHPGECEEINGWANCGQWFERPAVTQIGTALVACLPWPRRAFLLKHLGREVGREDVDACALEALRGVLRGFAEKWRNHVGPKVLLGHVSIRGHKVGPDQPEVGFDGVHLGLEDLALAEADAYLLGHIHMPQDWIVPSGVPVIYAGSPRRTAYAQGELVEKGYVVLEFGDEDRVPDWERVPTPATPMALLEYELTEGTLTVLHGAERRDRIEYVGAEVRLRYHFDAPDADQAHRIAADTADQIRAAGAAEVRLDPCMRPGTRARAPEVAAARGTRDKLCAYWESREEMPPEDDAGRLLARVGEMEVAVTR